MRKEKIKRFVLTLALSVTLSPCYGAGLEENMTPEQVKNSRYLSRALLSATNQKKQKISDEIKIDRERLQSILTTLESIAPQFNTGIDVSTIQKNVITVDASGAIINSTPENKTTSTIRRKNIDKALSSIRNTRVSIEKELPEFWKIWKKKTRSDRRKEKISKIILSIEQKLAQADILDTTQVNQLKKKITIEKYELKQVVTLPSINFTAGDVRRVPLPQKTAGKMGK